VCVCICNIYINAAERTVRGVKAYADVWWRTVTYADVCWRMLSVLLTGGWRALRAPHWAPAPRAAAHARGAGTIVVKSSYTSVLFTVYALPLYYLSVLLLRRCPPAHYIHCKCGGGWRTWTASLRTLCVCAWPSWSSAWYFFLDSMARSNLKTGIR
jgi:hypothetical protein